MHLHDLLHAASFNAAVEMQILAFLNLNVNICMLTFASRCFLFLKAAVFKMKLEIIHPQMGVVLLLFSLRSSQNGL